MFFAKVMLLVVTINLCVYLLVERITNCIEKCATVKAYEKIIEANLTLKSDSLKDFIDENSNKEATDDKDLRKNASGCNDPTAYEVLKNLEDEEERFHKLLHTIFYICKLADFEIEGRIVLIDRRTGKTWR